MPAYESNLDSSSKSSKKDKKSKKKDIDESNGVLEKKSKIKKEKLDDEETHKKKHKDSKNSDSLSTSSKSKRKKQGEDEQDQVVEEVLVVDEKSETSSLTKPPKSKKRKLSVKDLASVIVVNNDHDTEIKETGESSLSLNVKGNQDDEKDIPENLKLSSYRLTQKTIDSLRKRGVEALFPIQAATFDLIYDGKDVLARAKVNK